MNEKSGFNSVSGGHYSAIHNFYFMLYSNIKTLKTLSRLLHIKRSNIIKVEFYNQPWFKVLCSKLGSGIFKFFVVLLNNNR